MRGERIAAPIFAVLLVFSAVAGAGAGVAPASVSPVGTAEAQSGDGSGGPCGSADWLLTFVTGTLLTTDCRTAPELAEDWNESDAKQTRTQIHSQAGQLGAGNEQYLTGMRNALTDSNTVAFSKGEAAAVEALANGKSVSEAQQAANESIENYYTVKQRNLIDRWDVNVQTIQTLEQRAENTTGVGGDFVTLAPEDGFVGFEPEQPEEIFVKWDGLASPQQVTLVNGSASQVEAFNSKYRYASTAGGNPATYEGGPFWIDSRLKDDGGGGIVRHAKVRPTDNLSSTEAADFAEFRSVYREVENRSQRTKEEVAVYVNQSLAPAVESGDLNATSYVSPATLAQEYAQSYNGSESYIRATAIAAYSGMDAPSLEETGSMTVTHDGKTYEGLLLSQEAPSGGWQSGEQYDPALLSGLQMIAVAGDNSSIVELDGPFTVESIQGTDGEQIETATTVNITYETANSSEDYAELQQQIRSLNEQIEERQAEATTGGSDTQTNTNGLLAKIAAALGVGTGVVLLVAAGAVVVIARIYLPDS